MRLTILCLNSELLVHCLWLPNFRGCQAKIPDRIASYAYGMAISHARHVALSEHMAVLAIYEARAATDDYRRPLFCKCVRVELRNWPR